MTTEEQTLLKAWFTNEDFRLCEEKEECLSYCMRSRTPESAFLYYQSCMMYNDFRRFMRSIDMLLHIFP